MIILGIETSCDETAAAIIEDGTNVLSSVIASSQKMHAITGGIIPEQAARQQLKSIISVTQTSLNEAKLSEKDIDAVAVTVGPGLIGSLLVGVETAKTLSWVWDKQIIPVNHLVGHLYANWLGDTQPTLPAVGLVVSGGHTDLIYMKDHGQIELIGSTRDDAAGEAFDKTARLLGLPYPGGPSIALASQQYLDQKLNLFPRPLLDDKSFDFSFSGLKTAVLREVQNKDLNQSDKNRYAAEIQEAIVDVLVTKTTRAIDKYSPKSFLLAGGVAANSRLREKFEEKLDKMNVEFFVPSPELCTDNAAYIASCAYFNNNPVSWSEIDANPELTITD